MTATKKPKTDLSPEQIRDISVEVYKRRLEDDCRGNAGRMLAKDAEKDPNDGGKRLRVRAASYDVLTRHYVAVLS